MVFNRPVALVDVLLRSNIIKPIPTKGANIRVDMVALIVSRDMNTTKSIMKPITID